MLRAPAAPRHPSSARDAGSEGALIGMMGSAASAAASDAAAAPAAAMGAGEGAGGATSPATGAPSAPATSPGVAKAQAVLDAIPGVDMDDDGVFKYILIDVDVDGHRKFVVRGYEDCEYHADIFDRVRGGMEGLGARVQCKGGGRIKHEPERGAVFVYGYSMGYGRADHTIAVSVLKDAFPTYTDITYSNDGY